MLLKMRIKNESELEATMKALSLEHGMAVVAVVKPFSHEVLFQGFARPSAVPAHLMEPACNTIAWKGQLQQFSKAAQIREQNSCLCSR